MRLNGSKMFIFYTSITGKYLFLSMYSLLHTADYTHIAPRYIEEIFRKYSVEILQYCNNIYKAVRKVSEILQEPCNVRSKHYE